MIFSNEEIIKSSGDLRVGGIETNEKNINFLNYTEKVKCRFIKLVGEQVTDSMKNGMSREDALVEVFEIVSQYLHIEENVYDYSIEGIANQIVESIEYKNWEGKIYNRFMNFHPGVISQETPIPVQTKPTIVIDMGLENEDDTASLLDVLSGLISNK